MAGLDSRPGGGVARVAEERPLGEALAEEQRRFQAVARRSEAMAGMERVPARFAAGETRRAVYGEPSR